jgi:hypothetical protein
MTGIRSCSIGRSGATGMVVRMSLASPAWRALAGKNPVQHRLGGSLVVSDERDGAAVPVRCRAQQQVDAAAGHGLAQAGQLTWVVVQLHGEGAHLMPLSGNAAQHRRSPRT